LNISYVKFSVGHHDESNNMIFGG